MNDITGDELHEIASKLLDLRRNIINTKCIKSNSNDINKLLMVINNDDKYKVVMRCMNDIKGTSTKKVSKIIKGEMDNVFYLNWYKNNQSKILTTIKQNINNWIKLRNETGFGEFINKLPTKIKQRKRKRKTKTNKMNEMMHQQTPKSIIINAKETKHQIQQKQPKETVNEIEGDATSPTSLTAKQTVNSTANEIESDAKSTPSIAPNSCSSTATIKSPVTTFKSGVTTIKSGVTTPATSSNSPQSSIQPTIVDEFQQQQQKQNEIKLNSTSQQAQSINDNLQTFNTKQIENKLPAKSPPSIAPNSSSTKATSSNSPKSQTQPIIIDELQQKQFNQAPNSMYVINITILL